MDDGKDERKRAHLRLVVDNEKRNGQTDEDGIIPFEELAGMRDALRPAFYGDMSRQQGKAFEEIEQFLLARGWAYGLDPHHGRVLVLPVGVVCPELVEGGGSFYDEILLLVNEDVTGEGYCLTLETVLPFYSYDEAVMEDALLYGPMFPYGALFLEENRQDGFLDLIYRLSFPLFPPAPTEKLIARLFAVAVYELREAMRAFTEDQGK